MEQSLPQLILPIKLEKSSERLTSLGGLVVLEELVRGLNVWEQVDGALEGPKSGRGYEPHEFVQPLVWMRTREAVGWKTCGSCGPSARCWSDWVWKRCRTPGRWATGYGGRGRPGPRRWSA